MDDVLARHLLGCVELFFRQRFQTVRALDLVTFIFVPNPDFEREPFNEVCLILVKALVLHWYSFVDLLDLLRGRLVRELLDAEKAVEAVYEAAGDGLDAGLAFRHGADELRVFGAVEVVESPVAPGHEHHGLPESLAGLVRAGALQVEAPAGLSPWSGLLFELEVIKAHRVGHVHEALILARTAALL